MDKKKVNVSVEPLLCRCIPPRSDLVKHPMVAWYDPKQLFSTGVQVAISTALGTRVDARRQEGLFVGDRPLIHDYSRTPGGEIWFDYIADVGDGFKSTYQMAHLVTRDTLKPGGSEAALPRGSFLILGGDSVYPTASRHAYQERLLDVYQEAWDQVHGERWKPGMKPRAEVDIFAVPGNHDWYDGLVSFTRVFCQDPDVKPRYVGDWKARQGRSYFAIQLPHRWWLWSVDVQLESDIDDQQLRYFSACSKELKPGDQVILCMAEPEWALAPTPEPIDSNLHFMRKQYIEPRGARICLSLAGDFHHYRHHVEVNGGSSHKIISGGGGAFLHATHDGMGEKKDVKLADGTFRLAAAFPDVQTSRSLARRLLLFPLYNVSFSFVAITAYLLVAWGLPAWRGWERVGPFVDAILHQQGYFVGNTATTTWLMMLIMMLGGLTIAKREEPRGRRGFRLWGLLHGFVHVTAAVVLNYGLIYLFETLYGRTRMEAILPTTLRIAAFCGASAVVGSFLLGLYFYTSLSWFKRHGNDAFAGLRIADHKNFLRLHLTQDGELEIYPIGVEKVQSHPCDAKPVLIEPKIVIPPGTP